MSFMSTFGSFTAARLGIYAAQKGLNVTGNNISNINTKGYTRQVLDQISLKVGTNDRYQSQYSANVGSGTLCVSISQLRDPYLDIRYRSEAARVGAMDSKLSGLENLASIFDEVGKGTGEHEGDGVIQKQLNDLRDKLQRLTVDGTNQEEYDSLVRSSASSLTTLFYNASKELEEVKNNTVTSFKKDIDVVNNLLSNIRDLNESIRQSEIHGDKALEQRDSRNVMIDELSQYMKIDVTYEAENIGGGQTIERLVIKLANANPDPTVTTDSSTLVHGIYATQVSIQQVPKPNPDYVENTTDPKTQFKYLKSDGTGTDNENEAAQVDDPNYSLTLDTLKDSKNRPKTTNTRSSTPISLGTVTGNTPTPPADYGKNPRPGQVDNGDGTVTITSYHKVETRDNNGILTSTEYFRTETIKEYDPAVTLDDNDLYGSLQSTREMLTEKGEFSTTADIAIDENAATKRGIPYYQNALDALANKIATLFNEANQGFMVDEDGNYLTNKGKDPATNKDIIEPLSFTYTPAGGTQKTVVLNKNKELTEEEKNALKGLGYDTVDAYIKNNGGIKAGGALFSNHGDTDDPSNITAANISISKSWANGSVRIVSSYVKPTGMETASTDNSNILHLVSLMDAKSDYKPSEVVNDGSDDVYFHGTFQEMLTNISAVLANDQDSTEVLLDDCYSAAIELDTNRDSVSGVSLNDEAANLMQYQKSYSAACRLMTTLDEALDKLINGTGVVGR